MRAAVDVGTNTVRLLAGKAAGGRVVPARYHRVITRLGGGFTPAQGLAPASMERTLCALQEMAGIIRDCGVKAVRAVGTEALRRAKNGPAFVARVRRETGLPLEIIRGDEEARLTACGVLSALEPRPQACLIFDIGGGSTEFILAAASQLSFHRSYPIGVVALAENSPSPAAQEDRIEEVLTDLAADLGQTRLTSTAASPQVRLVGTAGTVTTLAALHLGMTEYDWRRVNNLVLDAGILRTMLDRLEGLSVPEREALPGMEKGRGDLIIPGLRLVLAILKLFGKESLTVSDFGLLEGLLLAGKNL